MNMIKDNVEIRNYFVTVVSGEIFDSEFSKYKFQKSDSDFTYGFIAIDLN